MFILYPHYSFKRIDKIPDDFFKSRGIDTLLLDVDNTLTGDNSQTPIDEILQWLERQKKAGMDLFILSNNSVERVEPFAKRLGLSFIAEAKKPLTRHLKEELKRRGKKLSEVAIIGDQIFTDVLCGRLAKVLTVRVEPMAMEGYGFFKVKRFLEKPVLHCYFRKKGGNI